MIEWTTFSDILNDCKHWTSNLPTKSNAKKQKDTTKTHIETKLL